MIKHKIKAFIDSVKLVLSLPTFWLSVAIALLAVISLIISVSLNNIGKTFSSSVLSNVFAGLITGLAISILSGAKSVYCTYLATRYSWLEETHKMLLDFINLHRELYKNSTISDEDYSKAAYETICRASWVNERILQGTFDKAKWFDPPKYFLSRYGYDALEIGKILYEFRDFLIGADYSIHNRKNIIKGFDPIRKIVFDLNHKVLDDMNAINIRLSSARKSLL